MAGILSVKDVMTEDVKKVGRDTSMQKVLDMMLEFDISSVVVVQKNRPVGLITHKDMLLRVLKPVMPPEALTVGDVMTAPVITIVKTLALMKQLKLCPERELRSYLC